MFPLVLLTAALIALRLYAAGQVGFGDSEALYASYAVHPQPAYLDHPGFIGVVARLLGDGTAPLPSRAHIFSTVVAGIVPWIVYAAARAAGVEKERAGHTGAFFAVIPLIAVGLFAFTPDLLLAPLWLGAIGLAIWGMSTKSVHGPTALLGAGLLAGVGASAKIPGLLLVVALAVVYAQNQRTRRSFWPWAGLVAGLVVLHPTLQYEVHQNFPMFHHRLVDTQAGAGLSLRNIGAVFGGQLVYLSPVVAYLAVRVAIDLVRHRNDDDASRILFWSFAIPIVPLFVFCSWSRVAEPHWLAPPLLALPIHAARRALVTQRMFKIAGGVALAFSLAAHAWVLVPSSIKLLPKDQDPKVDIATELYGWPQAVQAIDEEMRGTATFLDPDGTSELAVVGPNWTVCAQIQAALPKARVGCATPIEDDFDTWLPRQQWRDSPTVLWVTDNRYLDDGQTQLPKHTRVGQSTVRIIRGGRTSRVFHLYLYSRQGGA